LRERISVTCDMHLFTNDMLIANNHSYLHFVSHLIHAYIQTKRTVVYTALLQCYGTHVAEMILTLFTACLSQILRQELHIPRHIKLIALHVLRSRFMA